MAIQQVAQGFCTWARISSTLAQRGKPQMKENQKAKGKNQKAKIFAPGRGPDWGGIFRGWPQSKQSSMSQFLSGAGNWPPRGIFAARKEMGL